MQFINGHLSLPHRLDRLPNPPDNCRGEPSDSERLDAEVREVGAQGYVLKFQAASYLVLAIDALLAGGSFFGERRAPQRVKDEEPNRGVSFRLGFIPAR